MEKIRILIVDDTFPMRTFIKAAIKSLFTDKVEMDDAGSGEAAKEKLSTKTFDIVLCDWNMPGIKGTELLAWMKEQGKLKEIPFLMLTAHNDKELIMSAVEAGVSDYIMKPVTADTLNLRLRAAFKTVLAARMKNGDDNREPGEALI